MLNYTISDRSCLSISLSSWWHIYKCTDIQIMIRYKPLESWMLKNISYSYWCTLFEHLLNTYALYNCLSLSSLPLFSLSLSLSISHYLSRSQGRQLACVLPARLPGPARQQQRWEVHRCGGAIPSSLSGISGQETPWETQGQACYRYNLVIDLIV